MPLTRRDLLSRAASATILASVGGNLVRMTPSEAAVQKAKFKTLTPTEATWLAALGEAIAPPSRAAGLAHYVDHHLSVPHADSLLALRYLDVAPPYIDFYRPALASLAQLYGAVPPKPANPRFAEILKSLGGAPNGWKGPPAPLFLFTVRLDAIDIAYGTVEAFDRLGIDYLPHVQPETAW